MASLLPKAAEVDDLACKNFRVINQRSLWEERIAGCGCAVAVAFTVCLS